MLNVKVSSVIFILLFESSKIFIFGKEVETVGVEDLQKYFSLYANEIANGVFG